MEPFFNIFNTFGRLLLIYQRGGLGIGSISREIFYSTTKHEKHLGTFSILGGINLCASGKLSAF